MTKGDLRGWVLALSIAKLERAGGEYDYDTGEVTPPPEAPDPTAED